MRRQKCSDTWMFSIWNNNTEKWPLGIEKMLCGTLSSCRSSQRRPTQTPRYGTTPFAHPPTGWNNHECLAYKPTPMKWTGVLHIVISGCQQGLRSSPRSSSAAEPQSSGVGWGGSGCWTIIRHTGRGPARHSIVQAETRTKADMDNSSYTGLFSSCSTKQKQKTKPVTIKTLQKQSSFVCLFSLKALHRLILQSKK